MDSWNNGVLRLNLAQLTLGDDGEAAAELINNYLGEESRLIQAVLEEVDQVVFITKDGLELSVELKNTPLGESDFVSLFNS